MGKCYGWANKSNKEEWQMRTKISSKKENDNWGKMGRQGKEECKRKSREIQNKIDG